MKKKKKQHNKKRNNDKNNDQEKKNMVCIPKIKSIRAVVLGTLEVQVVRFKSLSRFQDLPKQELHQRPWV